VQDEVFSGQVERTVVVRRQIVQMTGLYGSPTHAADLGITSAPPSHGQFYHCYYASPWGRGTLTDTAIPPSLSVHLSVPNLGAQLA